MIRSKLGAAMMGLALSAMPAVANDFVNARIEALFAQGYTHFEVSRGATTTEIDAYGPNLAKLELRIANADGAVLSEKSEVQSPEETARDIAEIARTAENILDEVDDDADHDHRERADKADDRDGDRTGIDADRHDDDHQESDDDRDRRQGDEGRVDDRDDGRDDHADDDDRDDRDDD